MKPAKDEQVYEGYGLAGVSDRQTAPISSSLYQKVEKEIVIGIVEIEGRAVDLGAITVVAYAPIINGDSPIDVRASPSSALESTLELLRRKGLSSGSIPVSVAEAVVVAGKIAPNYFAHNMGEGGPELLDATTGPHGGE
jgi:hypothetical protein